MEKEKGEEKGMKGRIDEGKEEGKGKRDTLRVFL